MSIDSPPRTGRRLLRPSPAGRGTGGRGGPRTPEPPRPPGRRNPKWIALGVIAICLGGLLSYVIYARVATESAVVAMAATVYRGEVIEAADLDLDHAQRRPERAARFPSTRLTRWSASGRRTTWSTGPWWRRPSVTSAALPAAERAVVGLRLGRWSRAGRLPGARCAGPTRRPAARRRHRARGSLCGARPSWPVPSRPAGAGRRTRSWSTSTSPAAQAPTVALLAAQDRLSVVRDAGR